MPTETERVIALLRTAEAVVRDALDALPAALAGSNASSAAELVSRFDRVMRGASAGWALAAQRGAELHAPEAAGHRSGADWLAQLSGIPFARARESLGLAENLAGSAAVQEAFGRGELSLPQAQTIADTLAVDPAGGEELLEVARTGSLRELTRQALHLRQAARSREDEQARRARAHQRRSLRFAPVAEGGIRVQLSLTEEGWARCLPVLTTRAHELFRRGRKAKVHDRQDQYLADALVDIVSGAAAGEGGGGGGRGSGGVAAHFIVRVDAAALRRGWVERGEVCEIAGVGPVSVVAARDLLGDAFFQVLVTDGADVTAITGAHRYVPARLAAALLERDPRCVVPNCDVDVGLQTHHWQQEVRDQGPTTLANLCRICAVHHDLATHSGWRLEGGPGEWRWCGPDYPVSSNLRSGRRKIAAARAARGALAKRSDRRDRTARGPD